MRDNASRLRRAFDPREFSGSFVAPAPPQGSGTGGGGEAATQQKAQTRSPPRSRETSPQGVVVSVGGRVSQAPCKVALPASPSSRRAVSPSQPGPCSWVPLHRSSASALVISNVAAAPTVAVTLPSGAVSRQRSPCSAEGRALTPVPAVVGVPTGPVPWLAAPAFYGAGITRAPMPIPLAPKRVGPASIAPPSTPAGAMPGKECLLGTAGTQPADCDRTPATASSGAAEPNLMRGAAATLQTRMAAPPAPVGLRPVLPGGLQPEPAFTGGRMAAGRLQPSQPLLVAVQPFRPPVCHSPVSPAAWCGGLRAMSRCVSPLPARSVSPATRCIQMQSRHPVRGLSWSPAPSFRSRPPSPQPRIAQAASEMVPASSSRSIPVDVETTRRRGSDHASEAHVDKSGCVSASAEFQSVAVASSPFPGSARDILWSSASTGGSFMLERGGAARAISPLPHAGSATSSTPPPVIGAPLRRDWLGAQANGSQSNSVASDDGKEATAARATTGTSSSASSVVLNVGSSTGTCDTFGGINSWHPSNTAFSKERAVERKRLEAAAHWPDASAGDARSADVDATPLSAQTLSPFGTSPTVPPYSGPLTFALQDCTADAVRVAEAADEDERQRVANRPPAFNDMAQLLPHLRVKENDAFARLAQDPGLCGLRGMDPGADRNSAEPCTAVGAHSGKAVTSRSTRARCRSRLHEIFQECDADKSGTVNRRELVKACRRRKDVADFFGLPREIHQEDGSRNQFEKVFQSLDSNSDREVSWEEFQRFYVGDRLLSTREPSDGGVTLG